MLTGASQFVHQSTRNVPGAPRFRPALFYCSSYLAMGAPPVAGVTFAVSNNAGPSSLELRFKNDVSYV